LRSVVAAAPILAALLVLALAPIAQAADQKMSARQISEALTGNSVAGVWRGTSYKSYFRPDGLTIFQPSNGVAESGKWIIDKRTDRLCNWWAKSGWSCYDLFRNGRDIIWSIPGTDERYPSKLLPGNQL